jgi:hypothetical protein
MQMPQAAKKKFFSDAQERSMSSGRTATPWAAGRCGPDAQALAVLGLPCAALALRPGAELTALTFSSLRSDMLRLSSA